MEKKFKRTTVTSALPYANGPVHIGHLAGVYVPADIYVRYLRLKKEDVLFIGGSDEHGVPITIRAKKEGITPQDVVDRYHTLIKKSFEEFGISFDVYSRTTSPTHHQLASDFFKTLYNKGEFIEKTSEQYYDEEAKNAHNQLKNRKDSKKTESARVREEQNREEQTKRKDDDVVPKNGGNGGITPYQSWRKQVDGLSKNQLFREMVCMRSGYSVLLNKHFDTALEEFKKHIVLLGKEERMNSQEEVRSYFTFYTQAGQRTSQELHMLLQGLEKQQSAAAPPDPYRYEQLVDGRRTYLGCPIPDGAPPRPDNTAFWNETARSWTSQTPPPSSKKPKQKPG